MHRISKIKNLFIIVTALLLSRFSFSQIHCGSVELVPNTTVDSYMVFDDFGKYTGGIVYNSVARVRVIVRDKTVPDPECTWILRMFIENNAGAGTPITEWEEITTYGSGAGSNPEISLLEVRVRNSCATSPSDGIFRSFTDTTNILDIISDMLPLTPAGSCTQNVNGPGSYLTNYDEYNFNIDVRVQPGFSYNPGIFKLNIKFRLEENSIITNPIDPGSGF